MKQIIKSILDTDLYKLTMQQAVVQHFPRLKVRYKFIDRNKTVFPDGFDYVLSKQVKKMEGLFLTKDEKTFLTEECGKYLTPTYIDFLEGYKYDSSELDIKLDDENHLIINIEGYWYKTIMWEVSLMSLISELYFKETNQKVDLKCNESNDLSKLNSMIEHNAYFSDFGTRRRYSYKNEDRIIKLFTSNPNDVFVGTSNVHFAHKYYSTGIKVVGTCAHEFIMVIAALYGYKMANKIAMNKWVQTYNGSLGHMLTDTYTTDSFLKSFDMLNSKLFDGCRHDSGDPFEFADKFVKHYNSLGIDPKSKTLIFSDGLDIELATKIKEYCVGKIKCSFGIGTNITNNVLDTNSKNGSYIKPLNMVIKISEVLIDDNWVGAVKLSDNPIKHTGKLEDVELSKKILGIK